jgi:DNA sulfur modification protein DndD
LNAMKSSVSDAVGPHPEQHAKDLQSLVGELEKATEEESEARTDLDELTAKGVHSDPKLEQAMKEIHDLEHLVDELADEMARYEDPSENEDDDETYGIKVLKDRLDEAEKKLGEINGTLELKQKRDILVPLLQASLQKAGDELSAEIRDKANERIAELMPHNAVRVKSVGTHVVLQNKSSGSTGENLAVGYAFLATLFDQPEHKLPFIVDSPAGPIDRSIRKNAARLFPKLSHQLIAFTISTERDGFLAPLENAVNKMGKSIQYLTMFRKGRPDLDASASSEKGVEESGDGLWVSGRSFFENFQLEAEDDDAV